MCGDWGECETVRENRSSVWRLGRVWESSDQVCGDWGECEREQIKCVETEESVRENRSSVWRLGRV